MCLGHGAAQRLAQTAGEKRSFGVDSGASSDDTESPSNQSLTADYLTAIQSEPVARAVAQSLGVGVAELDFDVLVIGFHRSRTDAELFGDPIRSKAGANQPKDVQLAIGQLTGLAIYSRVFD